MIRRKISFEQYLIDFTAKATGVREVKRVRKGIAKHVLEFARERMKTKQELFHMQDLVDYVQNKKKCAPDSVSRILRLLCDEKLIRYRISSRSDSEYMLEFVADEEVEIK